MIRMIDEDDSIIPPNAFLPAAERYNLISRIDRFVIEKTFFHLSSHPHFLKNINFCSINLSGQSMVESDFLNFVKLKLYDSGISGEKICFEITETAAISNLSAAIYAAAHVKAPVFFPSSCACKCASFCGRGRRTRRPRREEWRRAELNRRPLREAQGR